MLTLLLILALCQHLICAPSPDPIHQLAPGPCSSSVLPSKQSDVKFSMREESDIIITCLTTILACTWTAMHNNIPSPLDSRWDVLKRRILWTFYAFITPELITALAFKQRLAVSTIVDAYNRAIVEPSLPDNERAAKAAEKMKMKNKIKWHSISSLCMAVAVWLRTQGQVFFTRKSLREKRKGRVEEWTQAHGFFVQMGGFMLSRDGQPLKTLSDTADIIKLIQEGKIAAVTVSEEELQDRSKGDAISKTFVIIQTTWFFMQCIARWSTGLVVTQIEVLTLGFVFLNGLTYAFWWNKPQNVGLPVYLEWLGGDAEEPPAPMSSSKTSLLSQYLGSVIPSNGRFSIKTVVVAVLSLLIRLPVEMLIELGSPILTILGKRYLGEDKPTLLSVPMFSSAQFDRTKYLQLLSLSMTCVAVLFGIVHLAPAWSLVFPSHRYMVLWRVCAVMITVIPLMIAPITQLIYPNLDEFDRVAKVCTVLFLLSVVLLYCTSRITLFVVAFVSLRNIPSAALITIDWIASFPHV